MSWFMLHPAKDTRVISIFSQFQKEMKSVHLIRPCALLHCFFLPKGSSVSVVLLIGACFALGFFAHSFAAADTLRTEWRTGICSGSTAAAEELG